MASCGRSLDLLQFGLRAIEFVAQTLRHPRMLVLKPVQ
jgi:hypothetical protein